jgi:hypothetical protein
MGIFKEQVIQFEAIEKACPHAGYFVANGNPNVDARIAELREWMCEMDELRIGLAIDSSGFVREDVFFVAWEMDDGVLVGVDLRVTTQKIGNGKKVFLSSSPAHHRPKVYDEYRLRKMRAA